MQRFEALSAQLKTFGEESRDPTLNGLRPLREKTVETWMGFSLEFSSNFLPSGPPSTTSNFGQRIETQQEPVNARLTIGKFRRSAF